MRMIRLFRGIAGVVVSVIFVPSLPAALTLTNPVLFVTQPPIPYELNSSVSNTMLSVVTIFGNQQADTTSAARGGDLWLMLTNTALVNLTRNGGFGTNGVQAGVGIAVRDPAIHWAGKKAIFSMVVGAPTNANDATAFFWQLYEVTNLDGIIANTNLKPAIVRVPNQPAFNNIMPTYATDGRIIFMTDRPYDNLSHLYPQLDEYKGRATVTGTYSLDPATGDLRMLQHTPSGAFNPFIDSFGRLIVTRWDHLSQDPNALDDRLGRHRNGSVDFASEDAGAATTTNAVDLFPEPRNNDTNALLALGVNGNEFNSFFPWALDQDGGNEEILNHVGRHELLPAMTKSFTGDTNLVTFNNLAQRTASGVLTANTNSLPAFFQIVEDPRTNGLYWGVAAQDISIFGGNHAGGQIMTLKGGVNDSPTNMMVTYITPTNGAVGPSAFGLYRNPMPMSDGKLIAAFTPTPTSFNFGWDTNLGTASLPVSLYHFRLYYLTNNGSLSFTNALLTPGISGTSVYWAGATLVTNSAVMWELQPVEVRARPIPTPMKSTVSPVERQVFAEEGVDAATFQADLAARNLALVISRNVTARDAADKQQPYNLRIPGGTNTIANSGKVYDITHLQFFQADYLRGYTYGTSSVQPGRRILATPMHATAAYNYPSSKTNAPLGGTELMSDGSQATLVPANRAVTWQLTGTNNNDSVVRERYWISFRPGEVRTCANCHGINDKDQIGRTPPANPPLALRQLLRQWRTNAVNSYALTVINGSGGGNFGAGSVLTVNAGSAPSGAGFSHWAGAGVVNSNMATTPIIMPAANTTLTAIFTNFAQPKFQGSALGSGGTVFTISARAEANQPWVLESSTNLVNWSAVTTNSADANGAWQFSVSPPTNAKAFFRLHSP